MTADTRDETSFVLTIGGFIDAAEHDVEALEDEFVQDVRHLIDRWRHHIRAGNFTGQSATHDLTPAPLPAPDERPLTPHVAIEDESAGDV